jgi:hypothetical protein
LITLLVNFMDQCGICKILSVLGMLWVPVDTLVSFYAFSIMGSLNVCSGESSTRTLYMRVMETFDDDDDDSPLSFII